MYSSTIPKDRKNVKFICLTLPELIFCCLFLQRFLFSFFWIESLQIYTSRLVHSYFLTFFPDTRIGAFIHNHLCTSSLVLLVYFSIFLHYVHHAARFSIIYPFCFSLHLCRNMCYNVSSILGSAMFLNYMYLVTP